MKLLPVLALMPALVLGCAGSSDKPKALPSITATPVAIATAEPVPSAANVKSPQGAEAFVRFYFAQLNVAFSTGEAGIARTFSDPICKTCANYPRASRLPHRRSFAATPSSCRTWRCLRFSRP